MRRLAFLLLTAAIGLTSASARAQPAAAPAPAPVSVAAAAAATPPEEPPYDPAAHADIPEGAWLQMSRGTGRRSTGMMVTGIVLVGFGAVFMGTGTGIYAAKPSCISVVGPVPVGAGGDFGNDGSSCPPSGDKSTGMAILVAGAIGAALGIPLWIVGASDVPWAESARLHGPAGPRRAWAPALTGAPGGAGLAWLF